MNEKFLPIGTICVLNNANKVMICGYYSPVYDGSFKVYDYVGCSFPQGILSKDLIFSFNHSDIEKIEFVGYKNEEQRAFLRNLNEFTGSDAKLEQEAADFHKENDMILTSTEAFSKLLFDENGVVMIAEPNVKKPAAQPVNTNIKFDENGYVISMGETPEVENPFYKEPVMQTVNEVPTQADISIFNNYKFNDEGVVESQETYKFNQDGVLTDLQVNTYSELNNEVVEPKEVVEPVETVAPKYIFDDDGVLIAINEDVQPVDDKTAAEETSAEGQTEEENK